MSHEPLTVVSSNGSKYVSIRWAFGVVVALLVAVVAGWGGWMQSTVTNDHDTLIKAVQQLEDLDRHVLEIKATGERTQMLVQQVLREHRTLGFTGNLEGG